MIISTYIDYRNMKEDIEKILFRLESDRNTDVDKFAKNIANELTHLGLEAYSEEWVTAELKDAYPDESKWEFSFWGDALVECGTPQIRGDEHPWDWYRISIMSVGCGGKEIYYVSYEKD